MQPVYLKRYIKSPMGRALGICAHIGSLLRQTKSGGTNNTTAMSTEARAAADRTEPEIATHRLRCAWYVAGVLALLYAPSFISRQIFGLLVGPLRRDLHIGDTQVSLLIGFSFALFYTFFGIPIGHLADIYSGCLIDSARL